MGEARILLEYPFGKRALALKLLVFTAASLLYAYLAFNTRESLFNVGFLLSFPTLTAATLAYRILALSAMLGELMERGEARRSRRSGLRGLAGYYLAIASPLLLFLIADKALALGILFGLIVSLSLSDLVYYAYVRYREAGLGGRLLAFVEPSGEGGRYVWGLTLAK